jgi:Undecaprenyl-phosphate glucose phosphotransferase
MSMHVFERSKKVGPDSDKATGSEPRVLAEVSAKLTPAKAYSTIVLEGIVRVVEFALIASVGFAMYQIYVGPTAGVSFEYMVAVPALSFVAVCVFQVFGVYSTAVFRAPAKAGLKLAGAWGLVFVFALAIAFFLKLEHAFSRVWLVGWFFGGFALLTGERFILAWIVRAMTLQGKFERRTVLVGGGPSAEPVLAELASHPESDLRILGLFDDRSSDRSPDVVGAYPKLGNVDDLVEFARHTRLDLVIFTLPISAEERLLEMLRKLWVLPIDIRLAAHTNKLRFRPRYYSYIGRMPVIDVFDKPIADWDVILKTAFDKIIGTLLLILAVPIMLAVAIAIKLDSPGPILFKQMRHGFNNENVEVYKFRSLYADKADAAAQKQVTKDDRRVTRVGRFIRRTSLDELPQLFNVVFKGNLSLVGPRPHAVQAKAAEQHYNDVVDGYFARHRVKPGITGWAQINGWRGETDTPEKIQKRVEHDLYYIENWSIFLDAYILLMTPFALLDGKNAY